MREIQSRPASKEYKDNYDRIFRKKGASSEDTAPPAKDDKWWLVVEGYGKNRLEGIKEDLRDFDDPPTVTEYAEDPCK